MSDTILDPIPLGTRVYTLAVTNPPTDWTEEAKATRKFGFAGFVIARHDGHGVCYEVVHDDLTVSAYEPRELMIIHVPESAVVQALLDRFGKWYKKLSW
jgi:hypothetical protein